MTAFVLLGGPAMPPLTSEDVDHVTRLAHLALTPEERETFTRQLAEILAYAELVAEVDTRGVPPTTSVLTSQRALRTDEVRPSLSPQESLANAPDAAIDRGLFRVPRVIGG